MRVHIGGDHAAYELHEALLTHLREAGHEVIDHGPFVLDEQDDYPVAVLRAAQATAEDPDSRGIVLGGSGNGELIAANKVKGIRAALCMTTELAQLARMHNDAQVVSLGGRFTAVEEAKEIVDVFLATEFTQAERHVRRLAMVTAYEQDGTLPPEPKSGPTS